MKTMNAIKATMLLATVLVTVGCASDDTIENEQQGGNKMPAHAVVFSGENEARPEYTRTTLTKVCKAVGNGLCLFSLNFNLCCRRTVFTCINHRMISTCETSSS